jgi:penicillin amidase
VVVSFLAFCISGCAPLRLLGHLISPSYPTFTDGQEITLAGLSTPVTVIEREDGVFRIEADTRHDLFLVQGYLQARDRTFQLELLRHMARGELAALLGDVSMGLKTALEIDRFNRFVGFARGADDLLAGMDPESRADIEAFSAGIGAWMSHGPAPLELRLLDHRIEPWTVADSLAISRLFMFGLTHNYTRELRRLLIACDAGLEALERVWPSMIEFGPYLLPPESLPPERHPVSPSVVPEMATELDRLCPSRAAASAQTARLGGLRSPLEAFTSGMNASNNWVVAGSRTHSGKPILAGDPHLPHMNPPVLWGVEQVLPESRLAGFTVTGHPYVAFGHNGKVAWSETINNVDLQDLYVERTGPLSQGGVGYERDGVIVPFEERTESFHVRGRKEPVTATARYTVHGVVLNDVDDFVRDRIPLTSLQVLPLHGAQDAAAMRRLMTARSVAEAIEAVEPMDSACLNWLFADSAGAIGWTSPCRVPARDGFRGTFPAPGWLSRYDWQGFYDKRNLPVSVNPERGWIASANNDVLPNDRFPSAYDNDASPPNRYLRIARRLDASRRLTTDDMLNLQFDTGVEYWPRVREELKEVLCTAEESRIRFALAARILCEWDGNVEGAGGTLFTLLTHGVLDRALADELSGGAKGDLWHYLQSIPHIETNVDWLWARPAEDPVWDDVRTEKVETRADIVRAALGDAVELASSRWGSDPKRWEWGKVRPFTLRHPLGRAGRILASTLDGPTVPGTGAPETVFKNQFLRSDREHMDPSFGPVIRLVFDFSDLEGASSYLFAGGQSGWPGSPHYADQLEDWRFARPRPLTPKSNATSARVTFIPATR